MANIIEINPALPEYFGKSCDWYDIPCHSSSVIQWIGDYFAWIPLKIYAELLEELLDVIIEMQLPVTVSQIQAASAALGDAGYIAGLVNLDFGATLIFGTKLFRFILGRIPVVGK